MPRLCLPKLCLPQIHWPTCNHCCQPSCAPVCHAPVCQPTCAPACNDCGYQSCGCGFFSRIKGMFCCQHNCCDTCDTCANGACGAPGAPVAAPVSSEPIPGPKAIPAQGTSHDGNSVRIVTPPAGTLTPENAPAIEAPVVVPNSEAINRNPF
jgi:hypothetical protein